MAGLQRLNLSQSVSKARFFCHSVSPPPLLAGLQINCRHSMRETKIGQECVCGSSHAPIWMIDRRWRLREGENR